MRAKQQKVYYLEADITLIFIYFHGKKWSLVK